MKSNKIKSYSFFYLLLVLLTACEPATQPKAQKAEPIKRYDRPDASILKGVEIPEGKRFFISSGQVSPPNHPEKPEKTLARYGDTYAQSIGILKKLEGILKEARSEERRVGKECRSRWSPYH